MSNRVTNQQMYGLSRVCSLSRQAEALPQKQKYSGCRIEVAHLAQQSAQSYAGGAAHCLWQIILEVPQHGTPGRHGIASGGREL